MESGWRQSLHATHGAGFARYWWFDLDWRLPLVCLIFQAQRILAVEHLWMVAGVESLELKLGLGVIAFV